MRIFKNKNERPINQASYLLSKTTIDERALRFLKRSYTDEYGLVEYTVSSGAAIKLPPSFITIFGNGTFEELLGQTYPAHGIPGKPYLMTDYIFLATEDGKKGAPWTRDPKTFEFFIRAAQKGGFLEQEYIKDGKRYINAPNMKRYIYDGQEKKRSLLKTNILLSQTAIDNLALGFQKINYKEKSDFVEYTLSSGQKIMLPYGYISLGTDCNGNNNSVPFAQLLGQTYPAHGIPGQPYLMTDYIFLATEDGKKGAPWTRDPKTFEFFIRAAQKAHFLDKEYFIDGKRYINAPYIKKFIFSDKV